MNVLSKIWEGWKKFGKFMGDFIGRLVLTVFYCTIFVPFALITSLFQDPLRVKTPPSDSYWLDAEIDVSTEAQARQQY